MMIVDSINTTEIPLDNNSYIRLRYLDVHILASRAVLYVSCVIMCFCLNWAKSHIGKLFFYNYK